MKPLRLAAVQVVLVIFPFAVSVIPRSAALAGEDVAACRARVATAARTATVRSIERGLLCARQRVQGKVLPTIDCADPDTWGSNGFAHGLNLLDRDEAHAATTIGACEATVTAAGAGYTACPSPCDALAIASLNDVAACATCVGRHRAAEALAAVVGSPALPLDRSARRCHQRIGRNLAKYANARMFAQNLCQVRKERGDPPFATVSDCRAIDDPGHPHFGYLAIIRGKLDHWLDAACRNVPLAALGSCGASLAAEADCIAGEAAVAGDAAYGAAFPPL